MSYRLPSALERIRLHAVKAFEEVRESGKSPQALLPEIVTGLSGPLASAGYVLQMQSEQVITFVRKVRPWFIWIGVVLLFPLGLLGVGPDGPRRRLRVVTRELRRVAVHVAPPHGGF